MLWARLVHPAAKGIWQKESGKRSLAKKRKKQQKGQKKRPKIDQKLKMIELLLPTFCCGTLIHGLEDLDFNVSLCFLPYLFT